MVFLRRLKVFILVLVVWLGSCVYVLPVDGTSFMQVETVVDAFAWQDAGSVFTFDRVVMESLVDVPYSRFSIKTESGDDVLAELLAVLIFTEYIDGEEVGYYYSPILESYLLIDGMVVNLQVSVSDGVATIGYPMIDIGF